MPAIVFLAAIGASLCVLALLTKRRFGVLGLALAAGALISAHWAALLTPFLAARGLVVEFIPLSVMVAAGLILTPPLLLLFSGPKYESMPARLFGSAAFGALAVIFLLEPLGESLRLDGTSLEMYQWLVSNHSVIIVAGLSLAVIDLLFARSSKKHKSKH